MTSLIHIADRVLNRPLLVTRDKAQVVLSVLAGRIGVNSPEATRFEGDSLVRDPDGNVLGRVPYNVKNGVAIITITGSLVNRGAWVGASSGLTSYEGIGHQIKTALADPAVHAAILDMHSPGGEAVGTFEIAELVRSLAAKKRTVAVVNGMAASAAYAIASGANEIVTTETGISGSIGVVLLHADFSRQLDREGITPTLIHAGAHKVDGNPFEPLSEDVKDDLQAEVNSFYEAFLKTVAKGRGSRLTAAAARKTEARTFIGQEAVDAGVADRVGTFESVLTELSRASGRSTPVQNRRTSMDNENQPGAEAKPGISQADHDRAVNAARQEGEASGFKAANDRITAIASAESIKGNGNRLGAAVSMAVKYPAMTSEDVVEMVTDNVAVDAKAPSPASLANREDHSDPLAAANAGQTQTQRILANHKLVVGEKRKPA